MEISLALARLGQRPALSDTPKERTENLKIEIPIAQPEADSLLREYQLTTYSLAHNPNLLVAIQAGKTIRRLSYRAYIQKLLSRE